MEGLERRIGADRACGVPCAALDEIADIYRFVPVGMGLFSLDYYYLRVNERMAEFNGMPADQHINRSIYEVVPDVADLTKLRIDGAGGPRRAAPPGYRPQKSSHRRHQQLRRALVSGVRKGR